MGGRFGDGKIVPDAEDSPVFPKDWHARALAVTLAAGSLGQWNLDISRHSRERLTPKDYTRFNYYEKWISALADLLFENSVITEDELKTGVANGISDLSARCFQPSAVADALAKGGPTNRDGPAPLFSVGQAVETILPSSNQQVNGGHTRLPAYAAGMTGRIIAVHGCHVFPDSNAHGFGEDPKPLYSVSFTASELWGRAENPNDEVILDLWEPYLVISNG